jgi:hypothetical protein
MREFLTPDMELMWWLFKPQGLFFLGRLLESHSPL